MGHNLVAPQVACQAVCPEVCQVASPAVPQVLMPPVALALVDQPSKRSIKSTLIWWSIRRCFTNCGTRIHTQQLKPSSIIILFAFSSLFLSSYTAFRHHSSSSCVPKTNSCSHLQLT